jgi:hypothetical protein
MDMHGEGFGKCEGSRESEGSEVVEVPDIGKTHRHCFHSLPGFTIVGDGSSEIEEDLECCYCQERGKKRHGRFWRGQP